MLRVTHQQKQELNNRMATDDQGRELHDAECSECGAETQVPFEPDPDRPVYCKDCFQKKRR